MNGRYGVLVFSITKGESISLDKIKNSRVILEFFKSYVSPLIIDLLLFIDKIIS